MTDRIKLVQGDELPYVNLTLTSSDTGSPIDVSGSAVVVRVYFRAANSSQRLSSIICEKVDPTNGKVRFNFIGGVLDVNPGAYEGEIEIDFDGLTQTLYDILKFTVRAQF